MKKQKNVKAIKKNNYQQDGIFFLKENGNMSVVDCEKDIEGVVSVPEGTTDIADYAFAGRERIKEILLPEGLRTIGRYAFKDCVNLTRIYIPESVTGIGHQAFSKCSQLQEIVALNMLDPYPFNCYDSLDDINRFEKEPSNRSIIFEDADFTIPVAFPKVRLNSAFVLSWKIALTLGFLMHPELYSSYDLNKSGKRYEGVKYGETEMPYAKYAITNKKRLLEYILKNDRSDMLRFYAVCGGFNDRVIQEAFLTPAQNEGAVKCVDYINSWLDHSVKINPIMPRTEVIEELPGSISSEEALQHWAYKICYDPEPYVCLTCLKGKNGYGKDQKEDGKIVIVPQWIDNIPVKELDKHVFHRRFREGYYNNIESITFGYNIKRINCDISEKILIKAPLGSYAKKYALGNRNPYEIVKTKNIRKENA